MIKKSYSISYSSLNYLFSEEKSVEIGRKILDNYPLGLFKLLSPYLEIKDPEGILKTDIVKIELDTPLILASCYSEKGVLEKAVCSGFGAVTTKSISYNEIKKQPGKTIVKKENGFLNKESLRNPGAEKFKKVLEKMKYVKPIFLSVASTPDYSPLKTIKVLEDSKISGIELNISCPNVPKGREINENPELICDLLEEVKTTTKKPIILKIAPGESREFLEKNLEIVGFAIDSGVDVINIGNTRRVRTDGFDDGFAGLSGAELFESSEKHVGTLEYVGKFYEEFGEEIQIIGTGGINSGKKAVELVENGASAIGILSGWIKQGFTTPYEINNEIIRYLKENGFGNFKELIGSGYN